MRRGAGKFRDSEFCECLSTDAVVHTSNDHQGGGANPDRVAHHERGGIDEDDAMVVDLGMRHSFGQASPTKRRRDLERTCRCRCRAVH